MCVCVYICKLTTVSRWVLPACPLCTLRALPATPHTHTHCPAHLAPPLWCWLFFFFLPCYLSLSILRYVHLPSDSFSQHLRYFMLHPRYISTWHYFFSISHSVTHHLDVLWPISAGTCASDRDRWPKVRYTTWRILNIWTVSLGLLVAMNLMTQLVVRPDNPTSIHPSCGYLCQCDSVGRV